MKGRFLRTPTDVANTLAVLLQPSSSNSANRSHLCPRTNQTYAQRRITTPATKRRAQKIGFAATASRTYAPPSTFIAKIGDIFGCL